MPLSHRHQAAKREDSQSVAPSRHLIVRHARLGSPRASSLTEIG